MSRTVSALLGLVVVATTGCEGPSGPQGGSVAGLDGPQGPAGAPALPSGILVWQDANGQRVPVVENPLGALGTLRYVDPDGNFWSITPLSGTPQPLVGGGILRAWSGPNCTGIAVFPSVPHARYTFLFKEPAGVSVPHVLSTSASVVVGFVGQSIDDGAIPCTNTSLPSMEVLQGVAVPVPVPDSVLVPLTPVYVP